MIRCFGHSSLIHVLGAVLCAALAAAVPGILNHTSASAQGSSMSISSLDCAGSPELVSILNGGSDAQDLDGWSLVSEPTANEVYDLSGIGELAAGATVNVQSGSDASGALLWSEEEIFRDDDATDFARLVDDSGATVDEIACAQATPTPTVAPTASPTPTAAPGDVPNGGGPPAPSSSPLTLIFMGAGLSTVALVTIGFALLPVAAIRSRFQRIRHDSPSPEAREYKAKDSTPKLLVIGLGLTMILLLTLAAGARRRH